MANNNFLLSVHLNISSVLPLSLFLTDTEVQQTNTISVPPCNGIANAVKVSNFDRSLIT